jgi:hypothetical protein
MLKLTKIITNYVNLPKGINKHLANLTKKYPNRSEVNGF